MGAEQLRKGQSVDLEAPGWSDTGATHLPGLWPLRASVPRGTGSAFPVRIGRGCYGMSAMAVNPGT